jgi:flagellar basal-body rod protein FlgB
VFDDVTSVALHSALRGLATRQRAIADNVANLQTPGFRANKVQFEDALRDAVVSGGSPDIQPAVLRSLEPTREDGNNVNLDRETLQGVDTGLRYQLSLRALDSQYGLLRSSIRTV